MLQHLEVTVFGDGDQVRDFVFVDDIVQANLMATEKSANRAYNLGHAAGASVNDIFGRLAAIIGYKESPIYEPARQGEIRRSVLLSECIRDDWGWRPQILLEEGLRRTVEHVRTHEIAGSSADSSNA
jgi:UDP-glucose 4-epimerase